MTEESDLNRRADEKSAKRKEARDKMMAGKTIEKGLLIVHTGKGKGKSTAAFGMVMRCIGHGMKVGVIQFIKGKWDTGERWVWRSSLSSAPSRRWAKASPGRPRTAPATSLMPARHGKRAKR